MALSVVTPRSKAQVVVARGGYLVMFLFCFVTIRGITALLFFVLHKLAAAVVYTSRGFLHHPCCCGKPHVFNAVLVFRLAQSADHFRRAVWFTSIVLHIFFHVDTSTVERPDATCEGTGLRNESVAAS